MIGKDGSGQEALSSGFGCRPLVVKKVRMQMFNISPTTIPIDNDFANKLFLRAVYIDNEKLGIRR